MTPIIERCRAEDCDAVRALATGAGLDVDPARELGLEHARLFVAREEAQGAPIAFLLAWHVADEFELLDVATAETARRRGLGRALLAELVSEARSLAASAIYLEVRPSNAAALALYLGAGFSEVGRRPRYYPDGEDALLLRREVESLLPSSGP